MLPQLVVISVFFFWPAGQALVQSFQMQDAFGMSTEWVGLENFRNLFEDPSYLASFKTTAFFSIAVAVSGIAISLVLAIFADRIVRGALVYKTALLLPYAVAPAVAGVLWMFMFSPSLGVVAYLLRQSGFDWNHLLNSDHAMTLIVIAAVWKQISYNFLFFLAGLQSIPKSLIEAAAIDGAGPWRRFWSIQFPLLSPTTFFLLVINVVYAFFDTFAIVDSTTQGGPGARHLDPGLQGLSRWLQGHGHGRIGRAIGGADGHRGRTDRGPVPLRREESAILMRPLSRFAPSPARGTPPSLRGGPCLAALAYGAPLIGTWGQASHLKDSNG